MQDNNIAIILTGTIIPNSTYVLHTDPQQRRNEYLKAAKYYARFAPVYFLENSEYNLNEDLDFSGIENLHLRKMPISKYRERGKGFQEFEMLDYWITTEKILPKRWIKITGRYLYENFPAILNDCNNTFNPLIIDQQIKNKTAITAIFYITSDFYKNYIKDLYWHCNDDCGDWVERIIYKHLFLVTADIRIFKVQPNIFNSTSGSTGNIYKSSKFKIFIKSICRQINYLFNKKYLYY